MQVRILMLKTMCLTSLHNIQQDLINFIPGFSSLLMQMILFLLLKQTVPNSDTRYFRASVIYIYTNPMVMYELMRIRHRQELIHVNILKDDILSSSAMLKEVSEHLYYIVFRDNIINVLRLLWTLIFQSFQ